MSNDSPPPTTLSPSKGRPRRRLPRVPPFYPVPLRARSEWTPQRQAHFLGWLAETGSVSAACARLGLSRKGAYQLRGKPQAESFAAAWDAALGMPVRRVTVDDLQYLAYTGLVHLRFRGGKYVGAWPKPKPSALIKLLDRYDRVLARIDRQG